MLTRGKLGMLAVVYRSLHLASRNDILAAAFTTSPSFLFTKPSTTITETSATTINTINSVVVARGRPLIVCNGDHNTISGALKSTTGGGSGGALRRKERGGGERGRGMSSASYGGGRGDRGGRARNGRRAPPDYGPDRPGQHRANVPPGTDVDVVQKQHQRTGQLTSGTVGRLLTSAGFHPRGIKVLLTGGVVGRVQNIAGLDATETHTGASTSNRSARDDPSSSSSDHDDSRFESNEDAGQIFEHSPRTSDATTSSSPRQRVLAEETTASASSGARAATTARSERPVRKFRADRVQGRSWSLEGGELVARGEGGEELRGEGAAVDERSGFDRRRGRGGRGRGRR